MTLQINYFTAHGPVNKYPNNISLDSHYSGTIHKLTQESFPAIQQS